MITIDKFTVHEGRGVPLRRTDVDTDQLAPARLLTMTTRTGYGDVLFHDWRLNDPDFVLNDPRYAGATVLVAGRDFATGSSREYAVWALKDYGFRAVIAPRFGDIFRLNALKNGLVPAILSEESVHAIWALIEENPTVRVTVDLIATEVRVGAIRAAFPLDDYTRHRLIEGVDETELTLSRIEEIRHYEQQRRPTLPRTSRRH